MVRYRTLLAPSVLLLATIAHSQTLEEVTVTGSRINEGYSEMPAITLKRKGDFLLQEVRFVNDSRSPDLRRKEIIDSIGKFIQSARGQSGIELSYGEGFLLPVDLTDDSLPIVNDKQRSDTNHVDVFVKSAVVESRPVKDQVTSLRNFIAAQKLTGRTEIERRGDIGLSIVGPEQYRYEILRRITQENERIREIVGANCSITVSGLEGRVSWERTGVDELTLFIGYGTEVKCGD